MKKIASTLVCLLFAIAMQAQTEKVTITLQDGSTVTYTSEQYDKVVVINELNIGVKVYLKDRKSKDYLATDVEITTEGGTDPTDNNVNRNSKSTYYDKDKKMWNLEWPRIKEDGKQSWVIKESDGMVTYALEWDNSKIANRFTCYQMYDKVAEKNVNRNDDFKEDPDLPAATRSRLSDYSGSGFSRGHLCPSADRLYSRSQNSQTFYLSNMQPQYQNHNGGQWAQYETSVRSWTEKFDTLYVVKAATIDDITLNNTTQSGLLSVKCNNRLPVPKYFYMALMGYKKSQNKYYAVGIWTYHYNNSSAQQTAEHLTIDELERRTGIDFFCNLPDDIEEEVEARAVDASIWGSPK